MPITQMQPAPIPYQNYLLKTTIWAIILPKLQQRRIRQGCKIILLYSEGAAPVSKGGNITIHTITSGYYPNLLL